MALLSRIIVPHRAGLPVPPHPLRDDRGGLSLEPHLAGAGRQGGFSGPAGFARAADALKVLLAGLAAPWR